VKAGFHETDITPARGMEKPGGYGKAYNTVFHDALKVRAGVFDDGQERVALVGIDTCVIGARTVVEARQEIERLSGIKGHAVMVGASHTHSGGPLFGIFPDEAEDAPEPVKDLALNHSTIVDPLYHEWAVRQIATAVCEADRCREEALIAVGSGHEDVGAHNRRFRMSNGRSYTHPGKMNPNILEPAGPIDPEVGVVAAWRPDGTLLGCVVNYACHGTTSPGGTSADWVYYMETTIRGAMGCDAVTVLLNGACGDVTQVDNRSPRESEGGEKWSRHVGARVGAEAVKVLVTAAPGHTAPVAASAKTLNFGRRVPSPESLEKCRKLVEVGLKDGKRTPEWTFAKERLVLDYLVRKAPTVPVEVQAVQVGPAVFLANPAEYFCQLGLDIKAGSRFPFTFVVELANGGVGYVPTEEAFAATGGGYETVLTSYSNLDPKAGPEIAQACIELARSLTPGDTPDWPPAPHPGHPWSYGILGPELE